MSQYLGDISAYALAVSQGYTGTEEEYAELMASYATVGQTAVTAAQTATTKASEAATSATTATNKASEATTAAQTATTKAGEASTSASTATSAKDTAVSASQTATSKASEATTAAATATSAKTDAVAANTAAQSAKTAAQTAQTGAETAAASVQSSAAQIQTNADDISELKEDFSTMESDGVVPSAEQIISDKGVTDSVPYHYRKTGGDRADRLYDQIVGGSVAWNQLVQNGDFSDGSTGWRVTNTATQINSTESKILTMDCNAVNSGIRTSTSYIKDHKYLKTVDVKSTAIVRFDIDGSLAKTSLGSGNWETLANVFNYNYNSNTFYLYIRLTSNATVFGEVQVRNAMLIDLTAMFGSTIADYIYSLEQSTAGAGVAFFKALFPNDYYTYNSGELVSVSGLSAHVMRDANDNIIRTYPLDSTLTLRGIPKLDSNNKLYFDGDTYDADGTVTRKHGVVDLGTLTWSYVSDRDYFYAVISDIKPSSSYNTRINLICPPYENTYATNIYNNVGDMLISGHPSDNHYIWIQDKRYSDAATFKTAMLGVMLVYELATPTTEEATPYQHLQQCDPNGTEEYVSTGIVPIGHNTQYPENLKAKIEGLPWNFANLIAPTESAFVATRNYTTGSLFIVDNVLYKATSNIANGDTITPNTNCAATTLAEIISVLA